MPTNLLRSVAVARETQLTKQQMIVKARQKLLDRERAQALLARINVPHVIKVL